jgi:hypothetical protein
MVECNGAGGLALDNTGCIWKFSLDAERKAGAAEKITALSDVKSIAGGGFPDRSLHHPGSKK